MGDLLQSEGWERFQHALGRTTERVDGVLAIRMPLPFGLRYIYSPRGTFPTGHCEEPQRRSNLTSSVGRLVQETGAVFWRAEFLSDKFAAPTFRPGRACILQLRAPAVMRRLVEPEWTWRTSLEGSDDELLARMHEKHRYNVRLAERRGVRVNKYSSESVHQGYFDAFWPLLQETAARQGIQTHPRRHYEVMLRELPRTMLYLAEHGGVPVACAIVASYSDTATYLHGGSSYEHRALMAPHLLHWQAMRDAKAAGRQWYEWGGIAPQSIEAQRWDGMTRFKMGFGGEAAHHSPMQDLIFRPRVYKILSWLAMLREPRERR